jgi:hypothetical protein
VTDYNDGVSGAHLRPGNPPDRRVTDCCGRLLPEAETLVGDVHFPDQCPACQYLDGREHDRHVSCVGACPGPDWSYTDGRIVLPNGEVWS